VLTGKWFSLIRLCSRLWIITHRAMSQYRWVSFGGYCDPALRWHLYAYVSNTHTWQIKIFPFEQCSLWPFTWTYFALFLQFVFSFADSLKKSGRLHLSVANLYGENKHGFLMLLIWHLTRIVFLYRSYPRKCKSIFLLCRWLKHPRQNVNSPKLPQLVLRNSHCWKPLKAAPVMR